jgi:ribosome biogenesis GTPase / thiamine phosphate phosphatase
VVAVQANFYRVKLDRNQTAQFLLCTRRSLLKKIGQKVMVGDRVLIEEPDWQDTRGAISRVKPRLTELQRPSVANAELTFVGFCSGRTDSRSLAT